MLRLRESLTLANCGDSNESPDILRKTMLELACALESNLTVEARRAADELMKTVRRKYAERPDLSFAHVVARLTSADIRARDQIGEPLSATQKARFRSAIAERRRLPDVA